MEKTKNFGYVKPSAVEYYDIEVYNATLDKQDADLKKAEVDATTKANAAKAASVPLESKGVAGGVVPLSAEKKIEAEFLPPMDYATSGEFLNHATDEDIHVTAAFTENTNVAIVGLVLHTEDEGIHTSAADKGTWSKGAQTAEQAQASALAALNKVAELESRVARVEDGLFSNITGNPFLASFDTITGIALTKGIWNKARQRIEC